MGICQSINEQEVEPELAAYASTDLSQGVTAEGTQDAAATEGQHKTAVDDDLYTESAIAEQAQGIFKDADKNADDILSHTEMKKYIHAHDEVRKKLMTIGCLDCEKGASWQGLFGELDLNQDGKITLQEFSQFYMKKSLAYKKMLDAAAAEDAVQEPWMVALRSYYTARDVDALGFTLDEYLVLTQRMHKMHAQAWGEEEWDHTKQKAIFDALDGNKDGFIDWPEFVQFFTNHFESNKVEEKERVSLLVQWTQDLKDVKAEETTHQEVVAPAAPVAAPAKTAAEEEETVRGSSTHVDLNNLKDSGTGELTAEEFAALRAKTKSAAEVAKNLTPEQQAEYGCKPGVAASAVRPDSDDSDDEGADFTMGGDGHGTLLGDY